MAKPPKTPKPSSKSPGNYAVGYGKPPRATQFQPGKSGNPGGASKKVRARKTEGSGSQLDQTLLDEIKRMLMINENGKRIKISAAQAITRSLTIGAVKGDRGAQRLIFDREQAAHERRHAATAERFGLLVHYHTNHGWGSDGMAPTANRDLQTWPHPIDIELDYVTLTGRVVGPITLEQAQPFIVLLNEYRIWQARLAHALVAASKSKGDMKALCDAAVTAIASLLEAIHTQMPPSFKVQLDWDDGEVPAGAMEVDGLNEGQIVNLASLEPGSIEMAYANYQLVSEAKETLTTVSSRLALNIDANTTSLINRLRVERQNGGGAPLAPAAPDFGDYYGDFSSKAVSDEDGNEP